MVVSVTLRTLPEGGAAVARVPIPPTSLTFRHPAHAASNPIGLIPKCAATRHAHFVMDGSGPVYLDPPSLDLWPDVQWAPDYVKSKKVDLNTLTKEEVASWKPGQTLLLNGKMLTGRDAAHKRIKDMLAKGEKLPVDFTNRVIYYVGPVDPVRDEAVGPAGPTTATRMDGFTDMMLSQTCLLYTSPSPRDRTRSRMPTSA
mgnify:CR=1 FL=1